MALKNFDQINKEKREIQVGGEIADVTRIPSRVMLELIAAVESGEVSEENPSSLMKMLELTEKVARPSNPKMTADYLLDNTDFETLIEIMEYIMEPVNKKMEEMQAEQVKNVMAQASSKQPKS